MDRTITSRLSLPLSSTIARDSDRQKEGEVKTGAATMRRKPTLHKRFERRRIRRSTLDRCKVSDLYICGRGLTCHTGADVV